MEAPSNMSSHNAPLASARVYTHEQHGHKRDDPYHWMKDLDDPETMPYIEAEQAYTEAVLAPQKELQEEIFRELKERIQEIDRSVPFRMGPYEYYTRIGEGQQYRVHCRRSLDLAAGESELSLSTEQVDPHADTPTEEVLLDENQLAEGHDFFDLGTLDPSPNGKFAVFALDTIGDELYTLQVKDLQTGELLPDTITGASGDVVWAGDNQTFFYVSCNDQHQPLLVYKHRLGQDPSQDQLIYEEQDTAFFVSVSKSSSLAMILMECTGSNQSEVRVWPADQPEATPALLIERDPSQPQQECEVDHINGHFYILTNGDGADDFTLLRTPEDSLSREHWQVVVPHRPGVLLVDMLLLGSFFVIQQRERAVDAVWCFPYEALEEGPLDDWDGAGGQKMPFEGEAFGVSINGAADAPASNILRMTYETMKQPEETYDIDLVTGQRALRKRRDIPGFSPDLYITKRHWIKAKDGVEVPVTVLYHKDTVIDGAAPAVLYGYGAYGYSMSPDFSSGRFSLVDRGWVYAIAHVRGGQELGYRWYLDGKMTHKQNSFDDFVACGQGLIELGYASEGKLAAIGRSAGGLLVCAAVNQAPGLFGALIAGVPFVDVLTTMLDEELTLTTGEYNEWGNPSESSEAYHQILAYSPYDNLKAQAYPATLVTAGLHDFRVTYWEPLKWVAKLRQTKTNDAPLLLHMNMAAGHFGKSGRYEYLREPAMEMAFLVTTLGSTSP